MLNLTLISNPEFFEGEPGVINKLLKDHLFTFHLRKPEASMDDYIQLLEKIENKYYNRIIIHNQPDITARYSLKGTHFSSDKRPAELNGYVGTSCHAIKELEKLDGKYDYMYISPVFNSISKKGYKSNLNINALKKYLQQDTKSEIVALGGVDSTNMQNLSGLGFKNVAVLGAVWNETSNAIGDYSKQLNKITSCLSSVHIA